MSFLEVFMWPLMPTSIVTANVSAQQNQGFMQANDQQISGHVSGRVSGHVSGHTLLVTLNEHVGTLVGR